MFAYDFQTNRIAGDPPEGMPYWRDVGTLDAYYEASMDLRAINPALNLYNRQWPLRTSGYSDPPAKFAFDDETAGVRRSTRIVSGGCILSGGISAKFGAGPLGARPLRSAGRGLHHLRQCRYRTPCEDPPRDPREERPYSGGRRDRL